MAKFSRTEHSEQVILNFGLDDNDINPPTSIRGGLAFVAGAGWVRTPFLGIAPRMEAEWIGSTMKYQGFNLTKSAGTSATDWIIVYRIYDANNKFLRHEILVGAWSNRSGLSWTIS